MDFDKSRHVLLADEAHKGRIHTTAELAEYTRRVKEAGVVLFPVRMPEWPPVRKSPLSIGGDRYKSDHWTGEQLAADKRSRSSRVRYQSPSITLYFDAAYCLRLISREMCGDKLDPHRLAYQWKAPVFDPSIHLNLRGWCEENEVDLPDFYLKFLPQLKKSVDREIVFQVTNPAAAEQKRTQGSYSPTVRVVHVRDRKILERFLGETQRYTYSADQTVTWQRSLDDTRWEARRQVAPQRQRWMTHRSWINRAIGDGAWTEADRDPVEGHAFGPFMELHDDGRLCLWVYKRALPFLADNPLLINGVAVTVELEQEGNVCRMGASIDPKQVKALLKHKLRPEAPPEPPDPRKVEERREIEEAIVTEAVRQDKEVYTPGEVTQALRGALGRDFRFFGGQTSDSRIVALTSKALRMFLGSDPIDKKTYVLDDGGRNYDCDNFAEGLRCSLISQFGINGVGVVWGDRHAWNLFVLVGARGPRIVFVEPQTDEFVEDLSGQYSVERRCEVLL